MAIDASKLKRRRGLGAPPTEGAPGIEEVEIVSQEEAKIYLPPPPTPLDRANPEQVTGQANPQPLAERVLMRLEPTAQALHEKRESASERDPFEGEREFDVASRRPVALRSKKGEEAASVWRERAPLPEAEPRVPFTTRVTLSTKERLENACYHLRRKHQDFINEAILAHLKKHGF